MEKLINKPLSGEEILEALEYKTNVVSYPDIKNYTTLDYLLGEHKCCVILYLSSPHYGHWCCLFERPTGSLEFFDPYGIFVDNELDKIPEVFKQMSGGNDPYLSNLIYNSHYNDLEYNDHQLQKYGQKIATCGRHCISRIIFKDKSIDDYAKMIKSTPYTPDEFVTLITKDI
jgi:hypothetical protein